MKFTSILRSQSFKALVTKAKKTPASVETMTVADLPTESTIKRTLGKCDTTVRVQFSNINYKDALVSKSIIVD